MQLLSLQRLTWEIITLLSLLTVGLDVQRRLCASIVKV